LSIDDTEVQFQRKHKLNSNAVIQSLLFLPETKKYQLLIPLCRMVPLPLVRSILQSDIKRLEQDFWSGYRGGDRCFYVSIAYDHGASMDVSEDLMGTWNKHWIQRNSEFEEFLRLHPDLSIISYNTRAHCNKA
jgi:hypothetical protein